MKEEAKNCRLLTASEFEFQVNDKNIPYVVNLQERTCDCRVWDVSGIPCKHVALAIEHKRNNIELYTDPSFHKSMYMKAYSQKIHGIPDSTFWPSSNVYPTSILPPSIKRMPGRPKKHKRREVGEGSGVRKPSALKCSKCGHTGHNKRTCGGPPVHKRRGKGRVDFGENMPLEEAVRAVK
ncbi:hypothetical protein Salat_1877300, partial [Sesamum alatum]